MPSLSSVYSDRLFVATLLVKASSRKGLTKLSIVAGIQPIMTVVVNESQQQSRPCERTTPEVAFSGAQNSNALQETDKTVRSEVQV